MTTFDDRERGFEKRFALDQEQEFNAAAKLVEAAALMATQPMTLQLRYLQTLTEIGVEKNTTIVFPLPMELINLFNKTFTPDTALEKKV